MHQKTLILALILGLAACAENAPPPSPHNLQITTAPLELPGIAFACYDLLIENGATTPETVISRGVVGQSLADGDNGTLCSTRFGNGPGGALSYIAPCDASEPSHTVTLWVDGLYEGTPSAPVLVDYQDPCPDGCSLTAHCTENADTPVSFNLTIMRPASQGFFDVAVNFQNIFCSAKVDCEYGPGEPIELLHNPATGQRGQTVVLGLACSAGPGATTETVLLRDPITITCDGQSVILDPTLGEGNVYGPIVPDPDPNNPVWQYATYFGDESLPCGASSCNKRYWNVAIGFDPGAHGCTLSTAATAGSQAALPEYATPEDTTWPVIDIEVPLTHPSGGLACTRHPLNGVPAGVSTRYTEFATESTFCGRLAGGGPTAESDEPCAELVAISAGAQHSCAIDGAGDMFCWGDNSYGQLGDGTFDHSIEPVKVGGAGGWTAVTTGALHTCGVRDDGTLWCWGYNGEQQLVDGTTTPRSEPVQIGVANDWLEVSAGGQHTCGRRAVPNGYGALYCWGMNADGQLGVGGYSSPPAPTQVGTETDWSEVSAGHIHTCGRRYGVLYCWGYNASGQLGDNTTATRPNPVPVDTPFVDWDQVTAGGSHTCARRGGVAWCWGANAHAQLGSPVDGHTGTPTEVGGIGDWLTLSAGRNHTCGIRGGFGEGELFCWGKGSFGQLGIGGLPTEVGQPALVGTSSRWTSVQAGWRHTCATGPGAAFCWGWNVSGQIGDGGVDTQAIPVGVVVERQCCAPVSAGSGTLSVYVQTALQAPAACGGVVGWSESTEPERPELDASVLPPVETPIQWVDFESERQLFGYDPIFTPGRIGFSLEGRPFIRDRAMNMQVLLNSGQWQEISLLAAAQESLTRQGYSWALDASWGDATALFATTPGPIDERIVFDRDCHAYTLVDAFRSSLAAGVLLHSPDGGRSWGAYVLPDTHWDDDGSMLLQSPSGVSDVLTAPPVILLHQRYSAAGSPNKLVMVVPEKRPNGSLSLTSELVATDTLCCGSHSGHENQVVSRGDLIHVAYPGDQAVFDPLLNRTGTPQYIVSWSRRERRPVSHPTLLGVGFDQPLAVDLVTPYTLPDEHNQPALAIDSEGYIHAIIGGHNARMDYTQSLTPNRVDAGWTERTYVGVDPDASDPYADSYTYPSLVLDADDRPVVFSRWSGAGYRFQLVQQTRNPQGDGWLAQEVLLHPGRVYYGVWFHKAAVDPSGRIFVSYSYMPGNLFADEAERFGDVWGLDLIAPDPEPAHGCHWTVADNVDTGAPYCEYSGVSDVSPGVLVRPSAAGSFRLATTSDFLGVGN